MTSGKLEPKSNNCIFDGYPKEIKGYYFYHKSKNKIVVARHAVFLEKEFFMRGSSEKSVCLEKVQELTHESEVRSNLTSLSMDTVFSGMREEPIS